MSNSYDTNVSSGSGVTSVDSPSTLETAKHEASDLTHTAAEQGKNVVETAKHEASAVLGEAKWQAKDLYAQTQREVKDQAATQQQRIAEGLRSFSDELSSMAQGSTNSGMATDVVRQVSGRLSAASTWLGDRDPGAVLLEVKRFARRKPGTFILAAVIVGVAAGRLTRALAASAADEKAEEELTTTRTASDAWSPTTSPPAAAADAGLDTPIYAQSSSEWADVNGTEDVDVRRDSV